MHRSNARILHKSGFKYIICVITHQVESKIVQYWTTGKKQRWSREHKARGQGQGYKKIRGQGQPFRGQTLSRPRTGMLEANDQGHSRKCSQKKGFQKSFAGDLQFIGVARIFD